MPDMLPPATSSLWGRLRSEPLLGGWCLIGGTALALQIAHRLSEDLDFAWPGGSKLPLPKIAALIAALEAEGWKVQRDDDPTAYEEFLNAGMSLHDHQQNFLVSGRAGAVRINLFSPDRLLAKVLPSVNSPRVLLPELPVLFRTKVVATLQRSASRDWLDLYILMTRHGFSMDDFVAVIDEIGAANELDLVFQKLCDARLRPGDPEYHMLVPTAPDLAELASFFRQEIRQWKQRRADSRWVTGLEGSFIPSD